MTEDGPRPSRRRRKPSLAERRDERAAVDDPAVVFDAALRFLESRPRSIAEVRRRLGSAGYGADLVEGAVARLLEMGILDDAAFGTAWVASRDRARPRGMRALRAELAQKGLAPDSITAILEEREAVAVDSGQGSESADEAAAERLLQRHAAALSRVIDPRKRRQRAYALLARSGFDHEICQAASRAFVDAAGVD